MFQFRCHLLTVTPLDPVRRITSHTPCLHTRTRTHAEVYLRVAAAVGCVIRAAHLRPAPSDRAGPDRLSPAAYRLPRPVRGRAVCRASRPLHPAAAAAAAAAADAS